MPIAKLLILVAVFFLTSVVSVITGSTSLITVPVMIQCGIEPRDAVATNMLALIFLSAGGLTPLWKGGTLPRRYLLVTAILTILGSIAGALLLTQVPIRALQWVIAAAMVAVAAFSLLRRDVGAVGVNAEPSKLRLACGYILTLALAVYGGFFSGG